MSMALDETGAKIVPVLAFREATVLDAAALAELRIDFMKIVKNGGLPDEADWREGLRSYFARSIAAGRLSAWLCLDGERVVATIALRYDRPRARGIGPGRGASGGLDGYIMSVYTVPSHRSRGIARTLMALVLDEAARRGLGRLVLHPTDDGVTLYESFGFRRFRTVMVLPLGSPAATADR